MPTRSIDVDGRTWRVFPAGRVTPNEHDEFGLVFVAGTGAAREVRITRYSPNGTRSREQSLADLSENELRTLFTLTQPSATSPEADYSA